ncbi:MAG: hypothetical protein KKB25_02305 [Nanoarchaeota archaeon]|nr:hypothetical protein [Nanoarchaeota archaeon]
MSDKIKSYEVKKIVRIGEGGLGVFLTKEANLLNWDDETKVVITVVKNGEDIITIKKSPAK